MKKKYSLDYSIERDTDRLKAIEDILDTLDTKPSNSELEQMASYILYGKDEEGKNAVQRGETTDSQKRYNSFKKMEDKNLSLDEILDNPLADQEHLQQFDTKYIYTKKKPSIRKPKYDKTTGALIDIGDADIPGMQELWDRIDYLEHVVAVNEGLSPADESVSILPDAYRLYQLKHTLIDVRRHQYYLKDYYKPTIHFVAIVPPRPQTYDWDSDSQYWISYEEWERRTSTSLLSSVSRNIADYEQRENPITHELEVKWVVRRHTFDWENPKHIKALIDMYSAIYMEMWDKLDSWGRTLIYDFDRYFDMCHFSPVREYILTRKIDKVPSTEITKEVKEKFGIQYNESHVQAIVSKEIPEAMAKMATMHRMLLTTPPKDRKTCYCCKRSLPRNNYFFVTNNNRKDHFGSTCKECDRQKRILNGGQSKYDRRNKDTTMHEV